MNDTIINPLTRWPCFTMEKRVWPWFFPAPVEEGWDNTALDKTKDEGRKLYFGVGRLSISAMNSKNITSWLNRRETDVSRKYFRKFRVMKFYFMPTFNVFKTSGCVCSRWSREDLNDKPTLFPLLRNDLAWSLSSRWVSLAFFWFFCIQVKESRNTCDLESSSVNRLFACHYPTLHATKKIRV